MGRGRKPLTLEVKIARARKVLEDLEAQLGNKEEVAVE